MMANSRRRSVIPAHRGNDRDEVVGLRIIGGSMRGRIESGQLVTLVPVLPDDVKVDDVVFIRWKGNYILHIVKEIGEAGFLIGNNLGKINGWAHRHHVLGKVTAIEA